MAVLIHVLDCRSVGIAFVYELGFLCFGHIMNILNHILGTLKIINLNLLVLFFFNF